MPPHKKSEKIKSTSHGLSAIARGINTSIIAQGKRFDRQLKANEEKEKPLLEFRASEAEKDRQHELRMAELLVSTRTPSHYSLPAWGGLDNGSNPGSNIDQRNSLTSPSRSPFQMNSVMSRRPHPYQPTSASSDETYNN